MRQSTYELSGFGLQGMVGLFSAGVIALIYNLFLPLASFPFYFVLGLLSLFGGIILFKSWDQVQSIDIWLLLIFSVILSPLAASLSPGYDGGLYHLPHQLWLREEAIVLGLSNLHGRFGFGSIYEYLSAPLWLGSNFILLAYLQISLFVYFLLFLVAFANISYGPHLVLLVGVSLNTAIYYGYINLEYTNTDSPSGFLFAMSFLFGHWLLYKDGSVLRGEWALFLIITLAAIFYKVSAILLLFWHLFVSFYRVFYKKDIFREWLLGMAIPSMLLGIYLFRNILTTGCLLYPESKTCLDLPWSSGRNADGFANAITAWARHPRAGYYSLKDHSWFLNWWFPRYTRHNPFIPNIVKSGIGVLAMYIAVALPSKFKCISLLNIRFLGTAGFIGFAFLFWFWKAPNPRFGIGVFLLLFPATLMFMHGRKLEQSHSFRKVLRSIVISVSILFACRIGAPWEKITYANMFKFKALTVHTPEVVEDSNYGVRPKKKNQCWVIPQCSPYDRPSKSSWHGRSAFFQK